MEVMTKTFEELVSLMKTLRGPGGCPWDREQKMEDLKPFVIEEAYEVVDAIDQGNRGELREEVGDLLLQVIFISQIAEEENSFTIHDAVTAVHDKLVRRHPHVFADVIADTSEAVLVNWEKLKSKERSGENKGVLSGVPGSLPALLKASRLTEKAARVGFDWQSTEDIFTKMDEEVAELRAAISSGDKSEMENELGDLLFTITNIARRLGVAPEEALQRTNRKFISRFESIEAKLRATEREFDGMTLEQLDRLWDEAKEAE